MSLGPGVRLGPYEVVASLGVGGMGEVYRARDTRLDRDVAVKVIASELSNDSELRARFRGEARAVAALNHPNIVTIHDIAEHDGVMYIALELVAGETLAERLTRGRIPLGDALRIAVQIAEGLAHAHAAGVVHRDLKPRNVMVRGDGQVKILDFGLGKFLRPTLSAMGRETTAATIPGVLMGTAGYIAPEQITGRPVDERADQFAFGSVLYEMLSGTRAFNRETALQILNAIVESQPAPLSRIVPEVPPRVVAIVERCLAKTPEGRYARTHDLLSEVRAASEEVRPPHGGSPHWRHVSPRWVPWTRWPAGRIAVACMIAAAIAGAGLLSLRPRAPSSPGVTSTGVRPVIAVLPLVDATGDPENAYLGVGIADAITTSLARVSAVSVVARGGDEEAARAGSGRAGIATALGADLLVEGAVQRSADRLRLTARLVEPDGTVRWAGEVEGWANDLFALERQLAGGLIGALEVSVTAAERERLAVPATEDPEALTSYHQGLALLDRPSVGDLTAAIDLLESAVRHDPRFGVAHGALSLAYRRMYAQTRDRQWIPKATDAATTAVALEPDHPQTRLALASVYRATGRNAAAIEELRRVLAANQLDDAAHREIGEILAEEGRPDEALREIGEAVRLRPQYWRNHRALALFLYGNGRTRESLDPFRRVVELRPDDFLARLQLGTAYHALGETDRAEASYVSSTELQPNSGAYSNLGTLYYARREYVKAVAAYQRAVDLRPGAAVLKRNLGDALLKVGRRQEAREQYSEAVRLAEDALSVNPRDVTTLSQLAVFEAKLGRRDDALRHAGAAFALNPASPDVMYRRAVVLALNGDRARALAALTSAINAGYARAQARDDDDLAILRDTPAFQQLIAAPAAPG